MNTAQQKCFNLLYQEHVNALRRQGKAERTIDGYARALQRITTLFDLCLDRLTQTHLKDYFTALVTSHSWGTVKVDRNVPARPEYVTPHIGFLSVAPRVCVGLPSDPAS